MANYTKEITHMLERYLIKILHQDKDGFYKKYLKTKLSLLEVLLLKRIHEMQEVRLNTLIEYLEIDRNVLSTTLKRLQSLNLIIKKPDLSDGRGQVVSLSGYGLEFLVSLENAAKDEIDFVLRDVTINEEKAILKFLSKMVQYHTTKFELEQFDVQRHDHKL